MLVWSSSQVRIGSIYNAYIINNAELSHKRRKYKLKTVKQTFLQQFIQNHMTSQTQKVKLRI